MERHENVEAIGFDQISVFNSLHIASRRERAFMTTRTLTGTYSAGYALSSNYSALMIAASGLVSVARMPQITIRAACRSLLLALHVLRTWAA